MNRMEAFEADWADRHDIPVDTLAQYRHADGSGYKLPDIAKNYRTWCQALDSVVVELPGTECFGSYSEEAARVAIDGCADAIEEAGIKWVRS